MVYLLIYEYQINVEHAACMILTFILDYIVPKDTDGLRFLGRLSACHAVKTRNNGGDKWNLYNKYLSRDEQNLSYSFLFMN